MEQNGELLLIELNEENLESMIYEIRGQRVMLDFDLARVYGYETRYFNRQVQRNIEKFPSDFMFQLNSIESEYLVKCQFGTSQKSLGEPEDLMMPKKSASSGKQILKCQNVTSSWGGTRKPPYAFTEQGIYMLMTVLRGELAIKQSITLIRLFERMKSYIMTSNNLTTTGELLKLTNQVNENTKAIQKLEQDNKDAKNKLEEVMDYFIDPSTYKPFIILNGQRLESDRAYQTIFSLAKHTIDIVDDYINERTLYLLLGISEDIGITIYSDNVARNPLKEEYIDYFKSQSGLNISIRPTNNLYHDRYIVIDYNYPHKKIFISGPSLKDAGNRIASIYETDDTNKYETILNPLLEH